MENKLQIPTETVLLPSKGLLYPEGNPLADGKIEIKYMTAQHEDILTNESYIQDGTVLDKLLRALIATPIQYGDLLIGDKNAIMIAARILGYGADYEFEYKGEKHSVDLSELKDKELDESLYKRGQNSFQYTLPKSGDVITFKLLTHSDEHKIEQEVKGLKKLNKKSNPEVSTRLKFLITSVNGDSETKTIREFVDNQLLAVDARALRKYYNEISPDVKTVFTITDKNGEEKEASLPIGVTFFWPDVEL